MLPGKWLFLFICLPFFANAQSGQLMVEGQSPDLYLSHTVGAKENFYSIGRMYNVSPREQIAPANKLQLESALHIGQVLKIPLTEINLSQNGVVAADEALIPIFYTVHDKETLYHVSTIHNKVPVANLKKWNKLASDGIPSGKKLIVGYLKVKKDLSPLAGKAMNVEVESNQPAPKVTAVEPPKPVPVKPAEVAVVKKDVETIENVPVNTNSNKLEGGYFKETFNKQSAGKTVFTDQTGMAGIFKSTSGWDDGKYYCLHNGAPPGTIIKITNTANQKSVYAKVLDAIPDLKQNEGLKLRLSNAAAEELGVKAGTFECSIKY